MQTWKDGEFWLATSIIFVTIAAAIIVYLRLFNLSFFIGPFRLTHWFTWIGTLFIVIYTPIYHAAKQKYPAKLKTLLRIHVFGNLLSFMLITAHFAQQISRPATSFPDLGTGLILYIVMPLLVLTGYLQRFRVLKSMKPQTNRFVHVTSALTFYITIVFHILHGLNII